MERMKKVVSLLLCLVMVVGLLPVSIFTADAADTVLDAAIFCSDVHGSTSDLTSVMSGVANSGVDYSSIGFVGDTCLTVATTTSTVQSALGDTSISVMFSYAASHDTENSADISTNWNYSGEVEGVSQYYLVYTIRETDMENDNGAEADFTTWYSGLTDAQKQLPIFIMSHRPLHARRNDNDGAAAWYDAISAAAESSDIVFFWAHNHTGETDVDTAAYYVAKDGDETISIQGGSTVTPNFTYMNAGYINANGQNPARKGVATTVQITAGSLIFQDYNSSGEYTDSSYSHNVTVTREFAGTTGSGDGDSSSTETTDPTEEETTAPTEGETDSSISNGVHVEGTDSTTSAYVYTATATADGSTGYILVSNGYALYNNNGTISATAVTVTDNVVTINDSSVDVADLLWTIDSDGDVMNDGYYLLRKSGDSATAMTISTTDSGTKYSDWTYANNTLTVVGGQSSDTTYYAYYDTSNSAFYTDPDSSQELKFYGLSEVTTNTSGTYYLDAKDVTTTSALSDTTTASLNSVITFVADGSTTSTTVTDLGGTYTYTINDNASGVIASVSEDGVVTINPNVTGTATVDVTYTWTVDGTEYSMTDTATIKVTEVVDQGVEENYTSTTTGSTTKTVYVLVEAITEADNYLIVDTNTATTSANLLTAASSGVTNTSGVTVVKGTDADGNTIYYIEDPAAAAIWAASSSTGGTLYNSSTGRYLRVKTSNGTSLTTTGESNQASTFVSTNNTLYRSKDSTKYYVRYNSGWTYSTSSQTVYVYKEDTTEVDTTVEATGTVSLEAGDPITTVVNGETDLTLDPTILFAGKDATDTFEALGGTYTVEYVSGDDIILSTDGKTVTLNGTIGTATVRVKYTWTVNGTSYAIWDTVTITTKDPYYTLDLHKASYTFTEADITEFASDVTYYEKDANGNYVVTTDTAYDYTKTYYTASATLGDEITETVAIKGVEAGDTYSVWAVIKYYDGTNEDGVDQGDVDDTLIEWTSSDESIATVDKNTGIITFTGKEGSVQITATYLNGNKPSDTVTISVTQSQYSVPSDGTNDFPEYPNEGAIRYDKTATAVGNFSETGIAMVELSMTGVPYTTGSELDVVLMLDITGSMHDVTSSSYTYSQYTRVEATIIAAMEFVKSIVVNEDGTYNNNRVGIYSFNSGGTYTLWELGKVTNLDTVNAAIQKFNDNYKGGGTPYDDGLSKVQSVLTTAKTDGTGNNRQQFAVFMTDGVPTDYEYITGTTHANYSSASSIAGMLTSSDNYQTRDTDYYYEYYSTEMKKAGVTVYSVGIGLENTNSAWSGSATQCLNLASRLLNDISGPANETTQPDAVGTSTLSKQDSYFFSVEDSTAAADMKNVFTNIATKIMQAATDVTVEDQITDEYTMIFDIPTDTSYNHTISTTQEFYIEFLKYTLDSNHERVDSDSDGNTYEEATSVTKLYLGVSNGTYYAASDASGTAYAAPAFAPSTIGDKGTLYYWTTDQTMATKAAVSYNDGTNTYYFIPYGMEANEDGTAPTGWYNMTSGAYAYGTVDSVTNTSTDLVIATPYFVYNASTKMLYWTVDKLDTAEYALRYFLYLDDSATDVGETTEVPAATYPTNHHAYITYTNFRGNDCQQKFPIPQLTWNGAQVSYVFYLVNSAGQPINKSGQVVDFANAVFVTDVYTKAVVWNKGIDGSTGTGELSADWLADELLPDEYTIYDELAGFELNVYEKADGTTIKNQFTIEGDTAANISSSLNNRLNLETTESTVSVVTTKVYNTKAGEKVTGYGTYYSTDANMAGIDFSNVTVAFAVVWESKLVPDVVVVDYGLDVVINVVQNDLLQNTVTGIGVGNSAYGSTEMNTGVIATSQLGTANLTIDGNTISIENENAVRFHQGDMTFTEPVKFYYESPAKYYEGSNQKTGYMYSSVTVIPATTIYYEDEFVTLKTYEAKTDADGNLLLDDYDNPIFDTVGTDGWDTDSVAATATQQQDRPGASKISADLDADNNYGYDAAYASMSSHSMGNAAKISVTATKKGEATFTFYGTGFDIISVTSNMTGTLMVQVTGPNDYSKNLMVDTYYGYTQNDAGEWVTSLNDPNALYQVPVIKLEGLTYGQYNVKLVAAYNEFFDHTTTEGGYDLYLDAVRIYDPTGVASGNTTNDTEGVVSDAYKADGEGWPQYMELRNNIIAASEYEVTENEDGTVTVSGTNLSGAIFIDSNDANTSIADYVSYGPNNELYLAPNQSVSFALDQTYASIIADVQIAMKLANGASVDYEIYNAATDGTKSNIITGTLTTATDMYYGIKNPDGDPDTNDDLTTGTIVIKNTSGGILSITNIKVTYTQNPNGTSTSSEEDPNEGLMTTSLYVDEEVATAAVMSLRRMPVVEEPETESTEPETEVTEPETETTEPETEATEPETEATEPETEATEPETEATEPETEATEPETEPEDSDTGKTLLKIIKKLLGWLFG